MLYHEVFFSKQRLLLMQHRIDERAGSGIKLLYSFYAIRRSMRLVLKHSIIQLERRFRIFGDLG